MARVINTLVINTLACPYNQPAFTWHLSCPILVDLHHLPPMVLIGAPDRL
jgi:hypothetical protein